MSTKQGDMIKEEEALVDEVLASVAKDRVEKVAKANWKHGVGEVSTRRKGWRRRFENIARQPVVYAKD